MQAPFKKYLHGGRLNFSDWLLPLAFLFLGTLPPRVLLKPVAQRVVRLLVSASHDRYSDAGNYIGLPSNTALFLSTGNKHLFLFQHQSVPFDS